MKHKLKCTECAEWSDTYKCINCGYCVVYAAEDMVSVEQIEECCGECTGEYIGDKHDSEL